MTAGALLAEKVTEMLSATASIRLYDITFIRNGCDSGSGSEDGRNRKNTSKQGCNANRDDEQSSNFLERMQY
jgi:hypothetical protein